MHTASRHRFFAGKLFITRSVKCACDEGRIDIVDVGRIVDRHVRADFGDICSEDERANLDAMKNGGRILSAYLVEGVKLWVITDAPNTDRAVTTVLYPGDY